MISPPFKKIEFGGRGGQISEADKSVFETFVTYE